MTMELQYPTLAPVVLGRFKQTTRPRNWCLKMACSPWLDYVSILVGLVNCRILLMEESVHERSYELAIVDTFVVAFFIVEMLIKMLAQGGFGYEESYLGNSWNELDLFINLAELSYYLLGFLGHDVKAFRVLGPMRLFGRVERLHDDLTRFSDFFSLTSLLVHVFLGYIFMLMGIQSVAWIAFQVVVFVYMTIVNYMTVV